MTKCVSCGRDFDPEIENGLGKSHEEFGVCVKCFCTKNVNKYIDIKYGKNSDYTRIHKK